MIAAVAIVIVVLAVNIDALSSDIGTSRVVADAPLIEIDMLTFEIDASVIGFDVLLVEIDSPTRKIDALPRNGGLKPAAPQAGANGAAFRPFVSS
jgi:hypothetical protein